jgi:pimeloyl-ACP methyl ester carboxylesterase
VTLSYCEIGSGRTVVILHGLLGSARNWQRIARQLAGDCRVITIDQRNHGDSPHVGTMSYLEMAADVFALLDRLGSDGCMLIGHSMGGKVAMTMALTQPRRCERLVVVDIAPVTYASRFVALVAAMQKLPVASLRSRAEAFRMLTPVEPDPAVRHFLLHNLRVRDGRYAWLINLEAIGAALPEIGAFPAIDAHYDGSVLFVRGEHSDAIQHRQLAQTRRYFPKAELITVEGAGHWPHAEAPEAFLAAVQGFLLRK